jgi:hypothetical protein
MLTRQKLAMMLFLLAGLIEFGNIAYGYSTGHGIHWTRVLVGVTLSFVGIYFGTRTRSAS